MSHAFTHIIKKGATAPTLPLQKVDVIMEDYKQPTVPSYGQRSMVIDPRFAQSILDKNHLSTQRPLNNQHVDDLVQAMQAGEFKPTSPIQIAQQREPNGTIKEYLINGQHTMAAIIKSGISIELPIVVHNVASEDAAITLYNTIDIQRQRTLADAVRAAGLGVISDIPHTVLNRLCSAAMFIEAGFVTSRKGRISREQYIKAANTWLPIMQEYRQAVSEASGGRGFGTFGTKFSAVAIATVGLLCTRYQPEKAKQFFGMIASGEGITKGHPCMMIREGLLSGRLCAAGGAMNWRTNINYIVAAWNAFYEGKNMGRWPSPNNEQPIILGTPYARLETKDRNYNHNRKK